MKLGFKSSRSRNSAISTAITVAVAIILVVLNAVIGEISDKSNLSVDLTRGDIYSISQESEEYLAALDKKVEIHVLADENTLATGNQYVANIHQILSSYNSFSNVTVDYIDLTIDPTYTQAYPGYELSASDVIVRCGDRIIVTNISDMLQTSSEIDYSTNKAITTINASTAEQVITNAIMFVSSDELVKISVLTGYSDVTADGLISLLEKNSFEVSEQSLITEDIDPEAQVAVLYAVNRDLGEGELEKFDDWLYNNGEQGKCLFIFMDANAQPTENLNAFLADWGMEINEGVAIETDAKNYYYYQYYPVAQKKSPDYSFENESRSNPIVMALSKPLDTLPVAANYSVTPLLGLSESGMILNADKSLSDGSGTDLMLMAAHKNYGADTNQSTVILTGSYQAFSSTLLTDSTFSNAEYLINLLNYVTGREDAVTIAPKNFDAVKHNLDNSGIYSRAIFFIGVLPVAIAVAGIVVWLKRRNR